MCDFNCTLKDISYRNKSRSLAYIYSHAWYVWHVRHQSYTSNIDIFDIATVTFRAISRISSRDTWDALSNNRPITLAMASWNLDRTWHVLLVRAHPVLEHRAWKRYARIVRDLLQDRVNSRIRSSSWNSQDAVKATGLSLQSLLIY